MVVLVACGGAAAPVQPPVLQPPVLPTVARPASVETPVDAPAVRTGIAGRVLLDGKPVTDFHVLLAECGRRLTAKQPVTVHATDGRFRIATEPAVVLITISGHGFTRRPVKVVAVADDHVVDLGDIAVARGHAVTGHVRDERGEPVAGARVVGGGQASTTDAAGSFELVGVGGIPGEADWGLLQATTEDQLASLPMTIPIADAAYDVTVHPTGTIEVTGPHTFATVSRVNTRTWLWGRKVGDVMRYELLPEGDYDVTLLSNSSVVAHQRVTVTAGAIVPVTLSAP